MGDEEKYDYNEQNNYGEGSRSEIESVGIQESWDNIEVTSEDIAKITVMKLRGTKFVGVELEGDAYTPRVKPKAEKGPGWKVEELSHFNTRKISDCLVVVKVANTLLPKIMSPNESGRRFTATLRHKADNDRPRQVLKTSALPWNFFALFSPLQTRVH